MSLPRHFYQVGYGSCEESNYYQLEHLVLYTEKEFSKIIQDCLCDVLIKEAKPKSMFKHRRSPKLSDLIDSDVKIRDVYDNRFLRALEKRGFKRVRNSQTFTVFGWASALEPMDWKEYTGEEQREFVKRLRAQFLKRCPTYLRDLKIGEAREKAEIARTMKRQARRDKKKV